MAATTFRLGDAGDDTRKRRGADPSPGSSLAGALHFAFTLLPSESLNRYSSGVVMLVRVLTAHIAAQNVGEANVVMRGLLDELRAQRGLAYVKLARRLMTDDSEEMVLFEEWLTPADLFRWTGGELQRARLPERAPRLFENLVITHYESLDRVPDDLDLKVIQSEAQDEAERRATHP
jgi:hypothetical protein